MKESINNIKAISEIMKAAIMAISIQWRNGEASIIIMS
jgi:hypothetical protein